MIRSLNAVRGLCEDGSNRKYFINKLKIHEIISQFIHINCSPNINCQQCNILPETQACIEMQQTTFATLYEILFDDMYAK
jgi:hypothetical protein